MKSNNAFRTMRKCLLRVGLPLCTALMLISCNGENVPDCFQPAGDPVRKTLEVQEFNGITVFENLKLVVKQGQEYRVEVETGENLVHGISAQVEAGRLVLRNATSCNFVRKYGLTTVYVTAPDITEIRSSTGLLIASDGVLSYPSLALIAESFNNPETETTDGSFDLDLDTGRLSIVVNGIAHFNLRGDTGDFSITVAAGDSRIEAEGLLAQRVNVNHRGSNDILVNPQERISGTIRGTGDVICVQRPPQVEVEELFNGRLIFQD